MDDIERKLRALAGDVALRVDSRTLARIHMCVARARLSAALAGNPDADRRSAVLRTIDTVLWAPGGGLAEQSPGMFYAIAAMPDADALADLARLMSLEIARLFDLSSHADALEASRTDALAADRAAFDRRIRDEFGAAAAIRDLHREVVAFERFLQSVRVARSAAGGT